MLVLKGFEEKGGEARKAFEGLGSLCSENS